ncbi:MAG: metallophosphatase family protein [Spirochaetaceae bacterium]|jgi:predicted phosphodiesterase|nr:metallophosphatase family protein [Spirochaetaceae bacterium]
MVLLILADIHANLSALQAVLGSAKRHPIDRAFILGDLIDYGMRPNEVISAVQMLPYLIDVSLWGNHEKAIIDNDLSRFGSPRGRAFSLFTQKILNRSSREYITTKMTPEGRAEAVHDGKKFLCVHGSLSDVYWKSIHYEEAGEAYSGYDYVLSAHSHIPHYFEQWYPADNPKMRNKKKTTFINPGSVGQPRNHNPRAAYAVLDTVSGAVHFDNAPYDIDAEQKLYGDAVDDFYKTRLEAGV